MSTVAFIGAGSFGTALSTVLAGKGHKIKVYDIDQEHLARMENDMENKDYLPGVRLEGDYTFCKTNEEALKDADFAIFALPAQHLRAALSAGVPFLEEKTIVMNISKGIELKTLKRMSQIVEEFLDMDRYVCISGPSHAEEVGIGVPTAVAVSSRNKDAAFAVIDLFTTHLFKAYFNGDMIGMEISGAVKNVMAVGSGIIKGMGYGDNTLAAMLTRGIAEMQRLGVAMGARPETFAGLAGIGDMIVTCTSINSRNYRCGQLIGQGMDPEEARKSIGMVVEGMFTAEAIHDLAAQYNVNMPISEEIYQVIKGQITVEEAVELLMTFPNLYEMNEY